MLNPPVNGNIQGLFTDLKCFPGNPVVQFHYNLVNSKFSGLAVLLQIINSLNFREVDIKIK